MRCPHCGRKIPNEILRSFLAFQLGQLLKSEKELFLNERADEIKTFNFVTEFLEFKDLEITEIIEDILKELGRGEKIKHLSETSNIALYLGATKRLKKKEEEEDVF